MKIYLASDHGGFEIKNKLAVYLESQGQFVEDHGPQKRDPEDDYPDYVIPLMRIIQKEPGSKAILLCRNGVGVCIVANRFKNIRAGISWNTKHAKSQRIDDNTNVLCLGADYLSFSEITNIVDTWMNTEFSNDTRHKRRLEKIEKI
jgi:RpiB/LacA/LacB family sugar-phosphate isomerase